MGKKQQKVAAVKAIRKEIHELLELTGWSQVHLAREVGVHESTVSLWISGDREPGGPAKRLIRELLAQARASTEKQLA